MIGRVQQSWRFLGFRFEIDFFFYDVVGTLLFLLKQALEVTKKKFEFIEN